MAGIKVQMASRECCRAKLIATIRPSTAAQLLLEGGSKSWLKDVATSSKCYLLSKDLATVSSFTSSSDVPANVSWLPLGAQGIQVYERIWIKPGLIIVCRARGPTNAKKIHSPTKFRNEDALFV